LTPKIFKIGDWGFSQKWGLGISLGAEIIREGFSQSLIGICYLLN